MTIIAHVCLYLDDGDEIHLDIKAADPNLPQVAYPELISMGVFETLTAHYNGEFDANTGPTTKQCLH